MGLFPIGSKHLGMFRVISLTLEPGPAARMTGVISPGTLVGMTGAYWSKRSELPWDVHLIGRADEAR